MIRIDHDLASCLWRGVFWTRDATGQKWAYRTGAYAKLGYVISEFRLWFKARRLM